MDKEETLKRIERIIRELIDGENKEIVGNIVVDILDIDDLALVKGNRIYFSKKVEKLSDEALKYIVAHELAHLVVKRHTEKFWEIVRNLYPDYINGKREVEEFVTKIKSR